MINAGKTGLLSALIKVCRRKIHRTIGRYREHTKWIHLQNQSIECISASFVHFFRRASRFFGS